MIYSYIIRAHGPFADQFDTPGLEYTNMTQRLKMPLTGSLSRTHTNTVMHF